MDICVSADWDPAIEACLKKRNLPEALKEIEHSIKGDPENQNLWIQKGIILYMECKFEEALEIFDSVLEKDPDSSDALNGKGAVLIYQEHNEEAEEVFTQILNKNPDFF